MRAATAFRRGLQVGRDNLDSRHFQCAVRNGASSRALIKTANKVRLYVLMVHQAAHHAETINSAESNAI